MGCTSSSFPGEGRPYAAAIGMANLGSITKERFEAHLEKNPSDVNGYDPQMHQMMMMQMTLTMMVCSSRPDLLPSVLKFHPNLEAECDAGTALAQAIGNNNHTCAVLLASVGASSESVFGEARKDSSTADACSQELKAAVLSAEATFQTIKLSDGADAAYAAGLATATQNPAAVQPPAATPAAPAVPLPPLKPLTAGDA